MSSHPGIDFNRRLAAGSGIQGLAKKSHRIVSHPVDADELRRRLYIVIAEQHGREDNDRSEGTEQTGKNGTAHDGKVRRQSSTKLQKPASQRRELVRRSQYISRESTEHAPTGGAMDESIRSKAQSGREPQSSGAKSRRRSDVRRSCILEEPVEMGVTRKRQSLFLKTSTETPGARESIYRDGVRGSPHCSTALRRSSTVSVTEAATLKDRRMSTLLDLEETIIEGPLITLDPANMRRVDWSQSDEKSESEQRMRNSDLRRRTSILLSKGRVNLTMQSQNEELPLILESDEQPSLRPVRLGFFAKMKMTRFNRGMNSVGNRSQGLLAA